MTKLLKPSIETLFAVLEQADWIKTLENNWIIFTSPPDEEGNIVDAVYPLEEGIGGSYRAMMEYELEQLGLIELAKPDANGWYKVSEVELVDRQSYLVYDDLCDEQYVVRYREADDYNDTAPTKGKPWWDMAYSNEVFPYKAFLYFQPMPVPPVGYPKVPDYQQSNVKKENK